MSKKSVDVYNAKNRIAIEEFVFVVEVATEIMSNKLPTRLSQTWINDMLGDFVRSWQMRIEEYYGKYKSSLYSKNDTVAESEVIINGKIRIYRDICKPIEIQNALSPDKVEYSTIYGGTLLAEHFMKKEVIVELESLAEKCVSKLTSTSATEYTCRLERAIKKLDSLNDMLIKPNNEIPFEISLWRENIIEESKALIRKICTKKIKNHSLRIRVLMLDSLIKAIGITPNTQEDKERFIAELIGIEIDTVGTYFNDFAKINLGLTKAENYKTQIKEAQTTFELLQSNSHDEICKEKAKGDRIIESAIRHISLAGTPGYKEETKSDRIVESAISDIT